MLYDHNYDLRSYALQAFPYLLISDNVWMLWEDVTAVQPIITSLTTHIVYISLSQQKCIWSYIWTCLENVETNQHAIFYLMKRSQWAYTIPKSKSAYFEHYNGDF